TRILERARHNATHKDIPVFQLDKRWLPELVALTRYVDGPGKARDLLARHGIILVIEKHLAGTYLDGAAMLDENDRPVIGLTLRFDRLDNFWCVLFHEIGHIFLHLMEGVRYDFFDEEGVIARDRIELEADEFALNSLIPLESWNECLSRFAMSEESVRIDAERLCIDVSIIAGRIRRERGNYTVLNNLVGQDHVRAQFAEDIDAIE
ncbi:MAG: ImmA/IrrE family metallo-endopeptidase, partial [Alphaproteobacteria bacterium]|nr:ImmA/IrrE family metallo-endopeptidase [Alphaproteobacteria bacterium]